MANRGNYRDLLRQERWIKKRTKILARDGYKCTVCGSTEDLQVHHTFYYDYPTLPWRYPDVSLITLCEKCHHKWHCEHENEIRPRFNRSGKKMKRDRKPMVKKRVIIPVSEIQKGRTRFRRKVNGEWIVLEVAGRGA